MDVSLTGGMAEHAHVHAAGTHARQYTLALSIMRMMLCTCVAAAVCLQHRDVLSTRADVSESHGTVWDWLQVGNAPVAPRPDLDLRPPIQIIPNLQTNL